MKRIGIVFVLLLMTSLATDNDGVTENRLPFKVVGYYSGDLFNEPLAKLQTDKQNTAIK